MFAILNLEIYKKKKNCHFKKNLLGATVADFYGGMSQNATTKHKARRQNRKHDSKSESTATFTFARKGSNKLLTRIVTDWTNAVSIKETFPSSGTKKMTEYIKRQPVRRNV